jgi:hypothetical protein
MPGSVNAAAAPAAERQVGELGEVVRDLDADRLEPAGQAPRQAVGDADREAALGAAHIHEPDRPRAVARGHVADHSPDERRHLVAAQEPLPERLEGAAESIEEGLATAAAVRLPLVRHLPGELLAIPILGRWICEVDESRLGAATQIPWSRGCGQRLGVGVALQERAGAGGARGMVHGAASRSGNEAREHGRRRTGPEGFIGKPRVVSPAGSVAFTGIGLAPFATAPPPATALSSATLRAQKKSGRHHRCRPPGWTGCEDRPPAGISRRRAGWDRPTMAQPAGISRRPWP